MFNNISIEPEERCGYYITIDVKKLWSVQLDLLEQLKRICKKHNIKYFACGGTLLGAVRHKGYIPWDDDIDVCMLTDDFEKFCEVAESELDGEYYFQLMKGMARIRNSSTTACTGADMKKYQLYKSHNCGIFIDIFPLHNVYNSKISRAFHKIVLHILERGLVGQEKEAYLKKNPKKYWKYYFSKALILWKGISLFYTIEEYLKFFGKISKMCKESNFVGLVSFMGIQKKYIWDIEWYSESCEMPFENTTICCPKEYDLILRKQYGDYTVFKKGGAIHTMVVYDAEVPYKEKLRDFEVSE